MDNASPLSVATLIFIATLGVVFVVKLVRVRLFYRSLVGQSSRPMKHSIDNPFNSRVLRITSSLVTFQPWLESQPLFPEMPGTGL